MFKDLNWKEVARTAIIAVVAVTLYDMILKPQIQKFMDKGEA